MIIEPHISLEEKAKQYHHNQGKREVAKNLKKDGIATETIEKATNLTKKEIEEL